MRRSVTAAVAVLLVLSMLPGPAFAAAPVALDLDLATEEDTPITITLSATDPESDAITAFAPASPASGALGPVGPIECSGGNPNVCTADVQYTPGPDVSGTDVFTYTATDGSAVSAPATVTITITAVNDALDARPDVVSMKATVTTRLNLFKANGGAADSAGPGKDLDDLTVIAVSKPAKGKATITDGGATVTYDPTACASGSDRFTYTVSDGEHSDTADVYVTLLRPGQYGTSWAPITDTPTYTFLNDTTATGTVPVRVSWCGVSSPSTTVRNYRLQQRTNAGSWSTIISATTATRSTRSLKTSTTYQWRVEANDSVGRNGAYREGPPIRVTRYQDSGPSITYGGAWGTSTVGSPSGGTQHYTFAADASASITVSNRQRFAIVGAKSSSRGSFRVYVDDSLVATVSAKTSSSTVRYGRVLYHRALTSGVGVSHTIRVETVGNGRVDLDAILVLGTP